MSGTHDPLASPALKRGITAACAQAGIGLQSRLGKFGGRVIVYWVLRITADTIYSCPAENIYLITFKDYEKIILTITSECQYFVL